MSNYHSSHSIVTNCTFYGNEAADIGGGIRNYNSSPTVTNCIVWGNAPEQVSQQGSNTTFAYCDIQDGTTGQSWFGTGCINADPNFVDADNPDFELIDLRLLPISPCIDAGDTAVVTQGVTVDLDSTPRALDDPSTPDTGLSFLDVTVDMGAYEYDPCRIEGDINCDGKVDLVDMCLLSANWLQGV